MMSVPATLLTVELTDDQLDELQVMGELHRLVEQALWKGTDMRFGIDLDEAQVQAASIIAQHYGLTVEEAVTHTILTALQEAVMGITRPGMTPEDVYKAMTDHSERLVRELKAKRLTAS